MTDPELSDRTYIEPLTAEVLERVIAREKPDALLPTVGGQTALNLAVELGERGILDRYGVHLIGASIEAIKVAEDRQKFKDAMRSIGIEVPESEVVRAESDGDIPNTIAKGLALAERIGFPRDHPSVVHARRSGRRDRLQRRGVQ
jgi:carbamoyl-phosphate synthase large subunit